MSLASSPSWLPRSSTFTFLSPSFSCWTCQSQSQQRSPRQKRSQRVPPKHWHVHVASGVDAQVLDSFLRSSETSGRSPVVGRLHAGSVCAIPHPRKTFDVIERKGSPTATVDDLRSKRWVLWFYLRTSRTCSVVLCVFTWSMSRHP